MDGALEDHSENGSISMEKDSKGTMDAETCKEEIPSPASSSSPLLDNTVSISTPSHIFSLDNKIDEMKYPEAVQMEKLPVSALTNYVQKISSLAKQKKITDALQLCDEALDVYHDNARLLEKKSKLLCQLHKFHEAHALVKEWVSRDPGNTAAKKEYDKLEVILKAVEERDSDHSSDEECPAPAEQMTDGRDDIHQSSKWTNPTDSTSNDFQNGQSSRNEGLRMSMVTPGELALSSGEDEALRFSTPLHTSEDISSRLVSVTEKVSLTDKEDLPNFQHSDRLFGEDTHKWHYRDPPRGLAIYEYALCKRYLETGRCTFGEKCTKAHSEAELLEWNHRIAERKQQLQQSDSRSHGGTYIEQLLEKLMCQESPKMTVVDNLDFVKIHVNSDLKVNVSSKKSTHAWTFTVTSKLCLHCVALMTDSTRSYFNISSISVGPRKTQKYQNIEKLCQEWINQEAHSKGQGEFVYRVKVIFKTDIYGTFRQSIVFDFGFDAILMREVQVESAPATDPEKIMKEITLTAAHRWNEKTVTLIPFEPRPVTRTDVERALIAKYTLPRTDSKFCHPGRVGCPLGKLNYRLWMHEMLYIEEMAQLGYISRFNVTTSLNLQKQFVQMPNTRSTVRYAVDGELFARLKLADDLSEDSMAGKLILQSSDVAWIADGKKERPGKVYEAIIEDKCKNIILMRLSSACVKDLGLKCDQDFCAQIQFQLNRLPMCERHLAVDRLPSLDIVFPQLDDMPSKLDLDDVVIEGGNQKKCLNEKQIDAVKMILAGRDRKLPPLLLVGPFGTGKTFTVAQAMLQVLKQEGSRILLCTHSNSAADIYINEFLHDYKEAPPLRVMHKYRWIETVPEKVLPFTLLEHEGPNAGTFRSPNTEDIMAHKIVIVTLSSARFVVDLDLPKDTFTHIFIDEAGQSLECETIIPLGVATEKTRIVFAGDHMQMSVEVYSDFARQQDLHTSLLERLHDYYPKECVYKVMLCENYRSHKAIVDFTSELFYDNKVISSGNIVPHEQFYPLTFYAAKGEEVQHENSTGFYNMSEVYEIVERVDELKKKWPAAWGPFDKNGISIVAPYSDQVARIRAELKKRKLLNVNVERVMNVQGKQYRVLMISITRTRLTCRPEPGMEETCNFGFLSSMKLLNTAITRAQSLVVVVGDPVSVCLVGECRKIWEYFLEICHYNNSLHGISWVPLREQLDRAELMKSFVLNPLAPEFVPKPRPPMLPLMMAPTDHLAAMDPNLAAHVGGAWTASAASHHHPALHGQAPGAIHGQILPQMYSPIYQPSVYVPYTHHMGGAAMHYPGAFADRHLPHGWQLSPNVWKGQHAFTQSSNGKRLNSPYGRGEMRHPRVRVQRDGRHVLDYGPQMPLSHPMHHPFAHPTLVAHHPNDAYLYHDHLRPLAFQGHHQHPGGHPYIAAPTATHPHHPSLGAYGVGNPAVIPTLHHHPSLSQHSTLSPHSSVMMPLRDVGGITTAKIKSDDGGSTSTSTATRRTDSPSSGIQLLPNVKHVPSHLLNKGPNGSSRNSSSSPAGTQQLLHQSGAAAPIAVSNGNNNVITPPEITTQQPQFIRNKTGRVISSRSYSPANYVRERSSSGDAAAPSSTTRSFSPVGHGRERASSGDDVQSARQLPSPSEYIGSSSRKQLNLSSVEAHHSNIVEMSGITSSSTLPSQAMSAFQATSSATDRSVSLSSHQKTIQHGTVVSERSVTTATTTATLNNRRKGPSLKLNTGFSRQYSDDAPTPSYITNMIQMIDETTEEPLQEERSPLSDQTKLQFTQTRKVKKTVAQTLQQRLVIKKGDNSPSPTASDNTDDGSKPSYASVLSSRSPEPRQMMTAEDFLELEIQTPQTPKGFITPGADVEVDPFGILKSLNIRQ